MGCFTHWVTRARLLRIIKQKTIFTRVLINYHKPRDNFHENPNTTLLKNHRKMVRSAMHIQTGFKMILDFFLPNPVFKEAAWTKSEKSTAGLSG